MKRVSIRIVISFISNSNWTKNSLEFLCVLDAGQCYGQASVSKSMSCNHRLSSKEMCSWSIFCFSYPKEYCNVNITSTLMPVYRTIYFELKSLHFGSTFWVAVVIAHPQTDTTHHTYHLRREGRSQQVLQLHLFPFFCGFV